MPLLYLALAFFYLLFATFVLPLVALCVAVTYVVGLPVAYVAGMGQVLVRRTPGLRPPQRWPQPPPDGDPAVLQYFYGPAMADAEHAIRVGLDNCLWLWRFGARKAQACLDGKQALISGPVGIGGLLGMVFGIAGGAIGAAWCAIVHLLIVGIATAGVRGAGLVLRGADSALLRVKNIRMVCPTCFERVPYPAYSCPGPRCSHRHRDVRPGRFGIITRRCRCGARMNTLLLFGSGTMAAYCPHKGCEKSLEHRPGEAPEIILPFFGATGAGKTRLVFSMVALLRRWNDEGQLSAEFADSVTAGRLDIADGVVRSGRAPAKTATTRPRGQVIRLTSAKGTRILQMYDAAGELFHRTDRTRDLRYLGKARTFVLVIDPLSVEAFWDRLPEERRAELESLRSDAPSPDLAYQQTHQEIEAMGVRLKKCRLAVVFSRADVVGGADHGDDVARWAREELGLGNMVRSTGQNFGETRFFRTAAIMEGGGMHESVAALTRWVLARDGIDLPGGTP